MMEIKLFVDMEGTLTRFYDDAKCRELMTKEGFFQSLKPYDNLCKAIELVLSARSKHNLKVYVLSPVLNGPNEAWEKRQWLQKHFTYMDITPIFCQPGTSKAELIKQQFDPEAYTLVLLDDYTANLHSWRYDTGIAIKYVNDINDRGEHGPLWDGPRVRYDWKPDRIANEILRIAHGTAANGGVENE